MDIALDGIEKINFKKGDIFFHEGDSSFFFYIIEDGEVDIAKSSPGGTLKSYDIIRSGEALGEFALLSKRPRSATATALTDGTAFKISEKNYEKLLEDLPGWAVAILTGLIERLSRTNQRLSEHIA